MLIDIVSFFSRLHPLFVHLPIGFLCFAILIEIIYWRKKDETILRVVPLLWLATSVTAIASAASGYFLSEAGGYEDDVLEWHKIGGIAIAVLSTLICLIHYFPAYRSHAATRITRTVLVLTSFIFLVVTGHLGGTLTHGSHYLTALPESEQEGGPVAASRRIESLDSADIFRDAVMPIFQAKCVSCHNAEKKKGELLLTGYEEIIKGGKTRAGVVPGNTASSEIYRRITLPKDHKEFMPTNGKKPLSETQSAILEWWIETGAHKDIAISKMSPNKKMAEAFNDFFQLNRDAIMAYETDAADPEDIAALIKAGFQVNVVTRSKNLLEVKYNGIGQIKPDIALLSKIRKQLVWLHLTNCQITDEDVARILDLENLYKLNLNRNSITDKGAAELAALKKLEYLNLYGNSISDSSLSALSTMSQLKKLYVWDTRVDSTGATSLMAKNKSLEVVYRLEAPAIKDTARSPELTPSKTE